MEEWQSALKADPLRRLFAATELEAHSSHVAFATQTQPLLQEVEELSKACEALHALTVEHLRRTEKKISATDGPRNRPPTSLVSSDLVHTGAYLNDDIRLRNVRVKVTCRALPRPMRHTWAAVSNKLFKNVENAAVQELVEEVISAHPPVTEVPLKTVAPPLIAKAPVDTATQAKPPTSSTPASNAETGDTVFPTNSIELWRWLTTQGYFAPSIDKGTVEQIEAEVAAFGDEDVELLAPVPRLEVVNDAGLEENCEHFVRTPFYERLLSAFILPAPVQPETAKEGASSDSDADTEDVVFVGDISVGERCHAELIANGLIEEEDSETDWLEQEIYQFTCGDDNEISRALQSHQRELVQAGIELNDKWSKLRAEVMAEVRREPDRKRQRELERRQLSTYLRPTRQRKS